MADIDFEVISPTTPQSGDALVTRRGSGAPYTGALTLTADLLARANHTGTQAISTVTGLQTALDGKAASAHTHTASDVSDFSEAVDDRVSALLVAGANVTLTYNDGANTLTIAASGGSAGISMGVNFAFDRGFYL